MTSYRGEHDIPVIYNITQINYCKHHNFCHLLMLFATLPYSGIKESVWVDVIVTLLVEWSKFSVTSFPSSLSFSDVLW